ncbi:FxsA family protein [Halalkalibacter krulwichiae]|uniref:Phage T7 F exclusion suppressor FxsA n=1 Tax=Halalkalibacter krulwichiae TaxID=199441 RepID=A0A1X9MJ73_9BACI|nr:FxsA family protein [Halalkalibacter krulwichiae]ARK31701.1 phage T7 F exclusion suppressor FxsA [Halalkalibacter krulwichiae]
MFRILLLLIIIVPAIEIAVLILSGNLIGVWPTIFLIIATGILGAWLAKKEGLQALRLAQLQTQQGQLPSGVILDGICILIGGVVLLTPGFITDAIGFFLLIPKTRTFAKALLLKLFHSMIKNGRFVIMTKK